MATEHTCPDCGQPATVGPRPPDHGTEMGRRFQWSRTGAAYFACPEHGPFSIREEMVDGKRVNVAVFHRDRRPDSFWVIE